MAFVDCEADVIGVVNITAVRQVIEIEVRGNLTFDCRAVRSAIPLVVAQILALKTAGKQTKHVVIALRNHIFIKINHKVHRSVRSAAIRYNHEVDTIFRIRFRRRRNVNLEIRIGYFQLGVLETIGFGNGIKLNGYIVSMEIDMSLIAIENLADIGFAVLGTRNLNIFNRELVTTDGNGDRNTINGVLSCAYMAALAINEHISRIRTGSGVVVRHNGVYVSVLIRNLADRRTITEVPNNLRVFVVRYTGKLNRIFAAKGILRVRCENLTVDGDILRQRLRSATGRITIRLIGSKAVHMGDEVRAVTLEGMGSSGVAEVNLCVVVGGRTAYRLELSGDRIAVKGHQIRLVRHNVHMVSSGSVFAGISSKGHLVYLLFNRVHP